MVNLITRAARRLAARLLPRRSAAHSARSIPPLVACHNVEKSSNSHSSLYLYDTPAHYFASLAEEQEDRLSGELNRRNNSSSAACVDAQGQDTLSEMRFSFGTQYDLSNDTPNSTPWVTAHGFCSDEHYPIAADVDEQPLPTSLTSAAFDVRPIVITETESPFRIVSVNDAWVGLCGYTAEEARGRTLGELIQGPETDVGAATALVSALLRGNEDAGLSVVNYDKFGRRFVNRLRVGSIKDEDDGTKTTHFVGVMHKI